MARIAHQRMLAQRIEAGREVRRDALRVRQHSAFGRRAEHLERDRRADRMRGVGRAMADRHALGHAVGDAGIDPLRQHRGAHRHIARGQALGECHQVGLDALGIAGEHRAGAAEAGDDLVHDEQDVELARRVAHRLQPSRAAARSPRRSPGSVRRRRRRPCLPPARPPWPAAPRPTRRSAPADRGPAGGGRDWATGCSAGSPAAGRSRGGTQAARSGLRRSTTSRGSRVRAR